MKTDTQLQQDVIAALRWEQSVNAARIGVRVELGVVVLSGYVNSRQEMRAAERAALSVAGVRALAIELSVSLNSINQSDDADIARSASRALKQLSLALEDAVCVSVADGRITLLGSVSQAWQRQAAEMSVRELMRVRGICNEIEIRVKRNSGGSIAEHAKALRLSRVVREQGIDVGVLAGWCDQGL